MQYQVSVTNFEGPLDLLLQLIERSELEIGEISVASVTEQYLGYLKTLDRLSIEELHWFIHMAGRLVHAKSQSLIAAPESSQDTDLADLADSLNRYRQVKAAADTIKPALTRQKSWNRPATLNQKYKVTHIDTTQLQQALTSALAKIPPQPSETVIKSKITLEQAIAAIDQHLLAGRKLLSDITAGLNSRADIVIIFLAVLEMLRQGKVIIVQSVAFGDLEVGYAAK